MFKIKDIKNYLLTLTILSFIFNCNCQLKYDPITEEQLIEESHNPITLELKVYFADYKYFLEDAELYDEPFSPIPMNYRGTKKFGYRAVGEFNVDLFYIISSDNPINGWIRVPFSKKFVGVEMVSIEGLYHTYFTEDEISEILGFELIPPEDLTKPVLKSLVKSTE